MTSQASAVPKPASRGSESRGPSEGGGPSRVAYCDTRALARKIRRHALEMSSRGGSSHLGSALSCADILAVLYGAVLRVDPREPKAPGRDRFILSKGHAGCAAYATLAELGFFPREWLLTHYQDGSLLGGHVSHKGVPGVEISTGALGHGLSIGAGMAYAARLDGRGHRVFVVLSDGECDEGSTWEAALFAGHHRLENLVAVVDYNRLQSLGSVAETLALEPFADKWKSFGWNVEEADGHDHEQLREVLTCSPPLAANSSPPPAARERSPMRGAKPTVVLAHTIKGKGVSFMENSVLWHYRTARGAEYEAAARELER